MNCPYNYDEPESRLEWFEKKVEELEFLKQIHVSELALFVEDVKNLKDRVEELQLEKDALWVKTQEDEREINDLRDAINEKNRWKEEALVVMNQWNEVSDYINKNIDVSDLGKGIPELCLKYLMERDEVND